MEQRYYRPIVQTDAARPEGALTLAGGWAWFSEVECIERGGARELIPAAWLPEEVAERLTASRAPVAGLGMERPRIMGILNVTPDSFSDGGRFDALEAALERAWDLVEAGAEILDIGGESTRPGAAEVDLEEEIERTAPVIAALRDAGFSAPISIDTRKAMVGDAAVEAGADMLNDVSAMEFDPEMAELAEISGLPICLMHAQGLPETMQDDPDYGDVLLDVYDYLEGRIALAEAQGIARDKIVVDPGIGFGKTLAHNLALLRGVSLFHGLGCAILLGVSRKRFIGTIGGAAEAGARAPGTLAVTLAGVAQGVQIHRVHDVAEIAQGLKLWRALSEGYEE
ncbi:dihydropteroate synthase [Rhodobacter xanthinilyticus]|uniref:Dihydropteroate synthase n=1 Tax=Rhodobacter xanthinilyticus TaxID=1850250 RepID=A0A1D9ME12_9RHOB|nr:dihydropteroate synthase [Rhodobacter xanthinilyticus]AOZ70114.1 dihydropteroate synthase [Rhodobacter xanthinilyticus]